MNKVDSKERIQEIIDIFKTSFENFKEVKGKKWTNQSGEHHESDTYEIKQKEDTIWVLMSECSNSSSGEINRYGIFTTFPEEDNKTVTQILEINLPYYFSKRFNTRVYENDSLIEIRHYGNFTIGRRRLKRICFFEYLKENGYDDEICIDEEGDEYICIIKFNDNSIEPNYLEERLIKWTKIVKEYKDYYRNFYRNKKE